jgi:hypothetical protein
MMGNMPGAFGQLGKSLNPEPSGPLGMEDLLAAKAPAKKNYNPIVDNLDVEPDYAGAEADMAPGGMMGTPDLPMGPMAEVEGDVKADMKDMLAERAKARAARSEEFQRRARDAGK